MYTDTAQGKPSSQHTPTKRPHGRQPWPWKQAQERCRITAASSRFWQRPCSVLATLPPPCIEPGDQVSKLTGLPGSSRSLMQRRKCCELAKIVAVRPSSCAPHQQRQLSRQIMSLSNMLLTHAVSTFHPHVRQRRGSGQHINC